MVAEYWHWFVFNLFVFSSGGLAAWSPMASGEHQKVVFPYMEPGEQQNIGFRFVLLPSHLSLSLSVFMFIATEHANVHLPWQWGMLTTCLLLSFWEPYYLFDLFVRFNILDRDEFVHVNLGHSSVHASLPQWITTLSYSPPLTADPKEELSWWI